MDTCSLLRVATWLATLIELSFAQIYSSIPLHVFTVPSEYPWSAGIRAPETPISRKLISYPSDILVQSNTIYYPPNSNSLPRNYFLPNPIPGKSPIIFRPTSIHRHSIPIRYEFSRVGNSLKTEGDSISKDSRRTGFVLDNSLSQSLGIQSSEPVRFWESKTVPVKPFPFTVFDGDRPDQNSEKTSEKVESPTTTKAEVAKLEPEAEATGPPAEVTTLSEATGLGRNEPKQFYKKEKNGRVIFGFSTEDQTRMESRDADAKVYGAYTYFDPTGNPVRMQYWDEGKGFHTAGNRLPQNVVNLPQSVTDTPEVQAARELHFKLYEQTLAHLKELQNLRPPADNGIYGGVSPGTIPPSKPTAPPTISEEDDDEVIIDSQKLPDYFPSAINSNANGKEGKDLDITSQTEGSEPSPTPNSESQSDPETVVIENPQIRSIAKRSIDEGKKSRTDRKMARHNAVFFDHGFPGNSPAFTTSQFPLFPAYSVLPATRVFTTPTQFRPSPPEQAHPLPGKFAPSVTTEAFKDSTSKTSTPNNHDGKLPESPFSDVAHRFEDLLYSKTPISAPSSDAFSNDEFTRVYLENSDELPASVGFPDEPHPWLTAPSAPEVYREEIPSPVHKTHPKLDFSAPPNSFSGFPPGKFDPPEILAPDFHIKDGHKKGSHLYGSNPLFSSFSLPSFLYPQSSQSIIRTDRPYDFKYHGSGPFQIFQKAPLPSVSYHVSHFDDDSSHFNFPSGTSQLSFSRPFIGHDYTLVDKNFPSSNSHLFFSSPFVPTVEFPPAHLPGEQVDQGLPGLGGSADKKPSSESKGENSGSKSDAEKDTSKPAASSTDGQVEQTTTAQVKESLGLQIVVPDAPAIDVRNEFPDAANNSQSETSNAVKSTEKPDAFESGESTEANESAESTEPNSVDVSSSSEGEKSDSSLVVDGRLTAEESTAVVESITEISTEAATEKTGSDEEKTGSEVEKTENEVEKIGSEGKPEIEAEKTESGPEKLVSEPANLGTEMKSPFEISESNLVRRDAAMYSVSQAAQMRRAVPVAAVHDAQASPKQRQSLENHQKMPVYVTTD